MTDVLPGRPGSRRPHTKHTMNEWTNEQTNETCFKLYLAAEGFVFTKHDIILWSHIIPKKSATIAGITTGCFYLRQTAFKCMKSR